MKQAAITKNIFKNYPGNLRKMSCTAAVLHVNAGRLNQLICLCIKCAEQELAPFTAAVQVAKTSKGPSLGLSG
jgi:hypothetical protein